MASPLILASTGMLFFLALISCQSGDKNQPSPVQPKALPLLNPDPRSESAEAFLQASESKWEALLKSDDASILEKARAALVTGKFPEASAKAVEALRKNRRSPEALLILAEAQLRLQNLDYTDAVLQAKPLKVKSSQSENIRGIAAFLQRDFEKSRRAFQSAMDLDSQSFAPAFNLALLALACRRFSHAQDILDGLTKKAPNNPDLLVHQGVTTGLLNKPSSAEPFLEKAIELNSKNALAHYNLAIVHQKQGDKAKFKKSMELYANQAKSRRFPSPRKEAENVIGH